MLDFLIIMVHLDVFQINLNLKRMELSHVRHVLQ